MRSSGPTNQPHVFVVEASAGSGKTYALAKRYVQLSLTLAQTQSVPIQSILAITFTNKATLGMKSRILDFFKRIALKQLKPYEFDDILKPLELDANEASELAFGLMNDVIRQYHYFQVQTIDSFVNILLVGCSFKIGLSARFKIQRNSKEYLQLSLDDLLDRAASDPKMRQLFEGFVRQYLFLENRSGWFPREDLLKVTSELFRQYNTYQKPLLVYPSDTDIFTHKRRVHSLMRELKELCPPETSKRFIDHINSLLADDNGLFDVDDLKSYWAKEIFPVNKGGAISHELEILWNKLTREICALSLLEASSIFNPYVILFEKLLHSFEEFSRRDDVLFLEELNHKAAKLFEGGLITVEELYFRLAARFVHYLIDEFQDTSLSQWRNLALMVEEAIAQNGSLFYVGDKKQAIYAFRGGESRLFDALQSQLAGFNVETTQLEHNYRSCPEIIGFNNRIFSLDNLNNFLHRRLEDSKENKRNDVHFSEADFGQIAGTFGHAHQLPGKDLSGGVVRVVHLQGRVKQEREVELRGHLIPLIRDVARRFALRDIAILTRGNSEVEEITQWLLQEGINASSERSSDIKNNPLVDEIISLLRFLYSPIDNNAFAQFCLGNLMPAATGIAPEALRDFLFNCARLSKKKNEVYFYKEFREAFTQVWEDFFEDFFRQVGVFPLYELTAGIVLRFDAEKNFPQYQGFLMHLLELIKAQEAESCDLSSFLDYYENLEGEDRFVPMSQVDAVKVLTVHKSKGLEFPVVIIPYLEMDIKVGSGGRDGSQSYLLDIKDEGIHLIRIKESYRQFCPELQQRYEQEYKKAFLIELNSVYVALTRAVEELYVFVPLKVGNAVNPAKFLIPEDFLSSGAPAQRPAAHEVLSPHQRLKSFVSAPWSGLQEELLTLRPTSTVLARQGEFYHAVLMHIGRIDESSIDQAIDEAWQKACRMLPPHDDGKKMIRSFIRREDVRPFFILPSDVLVFCEKEFVNKYGDTKRIDRLIVLKDEVWIIDYKLSPSAEDRNQEQIDSYVELIKPFYPKHKIAGKILYLNHE